MSMEALRAAIPRYTLNGDVALPLNAAGVSPMSRPAVAAAAEVISWMAAGTLGVGPLIDAYEQARHRFASLVDVDVDGMSFMQTCAAAISQVAFGLDLRAGDRIVRLDQEYPSNAYPWHRAAELVGAHVDVVSSRADFSVDEGALIAALTPRTRVMTVSWVQYQTGTVLDLARLAEGCRKNGTWLVVDAIQGLGALPLSMSAMGIDAVCGGTHKWLCGPMGHGFLALAPHRREALRPLHHGAITYGTPDDLVDVLKPPRADPRRFEPGTPLAMGAILGAASIALLQETGIATIATQAVACADELRARVKQSGYELLHGRHAIVTFRPRGDPRLLAKQLAQQGISVGVRAGGLRLSPHGFNDEEDIATFWTALQQLEGVA
jgi:cysteine desulfurase / selenocysteine lyase